MPTRRFEPIGLALLFAVGCVVFGDCSLIDQARAQQQSAPPAPPPTPPTQSPVVNPSNPSTVQQPSYKPIAPATASTTPSTPSTASSGELTQEETPSTAARSKRPASVAKTRLIHRHHRPGRSTLATYSCGYLGCVRSYPWAFPCQYYSRYCYPSASVPWWPSYYDYAPGQLGRGRPRFGGN